MGGGVPRRRGRGDASRRAADKSFGPQHVMAAHGDQRHPLRPGMERRQLYEAAGRLVAGVPHLQAIVPNEQAADRFIEETRKQADAIDANDILYSLESSADYDPEPSLASIRTKVFALNFADDEFNPELLHVLERLMPHVPQSRFIVQPGSETSFGHLSMAHPELWAQHVGEFMRWLGDAPPQVNQAR
jgi:homoserine O-acetyltransferase/O-succinyltransferase